MSIPEPLIQEALDASNAVYSDNINVVPGGTDTYQLLNSPLLDSFDLQHEADGFFAQAYVDTTQSNVIIAYEGSLPPQGVESLIAGQNQSYAAE